MSTFKIAHVNVRSLFTGFGDLVQAVLDNDISILAVSETWLAPEVPNNMVSIPDFHFYRKDRLTRGGGVGFYVLDSLSVDIIMSESDSDIEHIWIKVRIKSRSLAAGCFYRPPKGNVNRFIDKVENALSAVVPCVDEVIMLGDVNVNLFQSDNAFSKLCDIYNFTQLITEPTRITRDTQSLLDPVAVTCPELVYESGTIGMDNVSDHRLAYCSLSVKKKKRTGKFVTLRSFASFNQEEFNKHIHILPWHQILQTDDIDHKLEILNSFILELFDCHAPLKTVRVSHTRAPWLSDLVKLLMKQRDRALNRFRKTKRVEDWETYKILRNRTLTAIRNSKRNYLASKTGNREVWRAIEELYVKPSPPNNIPLGISNPQSINDYFSGIYKLDYDCQNLISHYESHRYNNARLSFRLATIDEVNESIFKIKTNAAGVDKITIRMIKHCSPYIDKYITHIVNCCLERNYFPSNWKCAIVKPLPKTANPTSYGDLRPVSILPALSKVLEMIMLQQIYQYFKLNDIFYKFQSGFRPGHGTTSALTCVTDNLLGACDRGMIGVAVFLDYSKAFDRINQELLVSKLHFYGLDGAALTMMKSYLFNRRQMVQVGDRFSTSAFLQTGVPQGSILGPLLYTIYTTDILADLEVSCHAYADDTLLYHTFFPKDAGDAEGLINQNLSKIHEKSLTHNLKLNANKCVCMTIASRKRYPVQNPSIKINNIALPFVDSSKCLGIIFDRELGFSAQVSQVVRKCYAALKGLYSHRDILTIGLRKSLSESLVLSHINYCCSVYGPCLSVANKYRLQKIQNSCCRFIYGLRRSDHVSEKIKALGWLNISNLIKMHIVCLVKSVLSSSTPEYLREKLSFRSAVHCRDVRYRHRLSLPKFNTSLFTKSFSYNAVVFYNSLPDFVKLDSVNKITFKREVKKILLLQQ